MAEKEKVILCLVARFHMWLHSGGHKETLRNDSTLPNGVQILSNTNLMMPGDKKFNPAVTIKFILMSTLAPG